MQFRTKRGLVDIPNEDVLAAARDIMSSAQAPVDDRGASPLVGTGSLVVLPDIAELPRAVRQRVKALSQDQWTEADWQDLLNTQRLLEHNIAARHGLLEQHNVRGEPRA